MGDAAHVLGAFGAAESEVVVEPVAQVVAVEHVGVASLLVQLAFDLERECRLARTRQPREPDGGTGGPSLRPVHGGLVSPDATGSGRGAGHRAPVVAVSNMAAATVAWVSSSIRMPLPVPRMSR